MNISDEDRKNYEHRMEKKLEEELRKEVQAKKQAQIDRAMETSGLTGVIREKTFDSYETPESWQRWAKNCCLLYADNPEGWLLLSGPTGCGKTHLCSAVVGRLIGQGIPVWYMLYREEIQKLKPMDGSDPQERQRKMWLFKTADALYIDDLFKGGASESEIRIIFELLDYRYRTDKRTIISTELSLDKMQQIDAAIFGRIVEKSRKVLIRDGQDRNYRTRIRHEQGIRDKH